MNIIGGNFYQSPAGLLVQVYGNGINGVRCNTANENIIVPEEEFNTFKHLPNIKFFPGTAKEDQPLPYEFDLLWDVKTQAELKQKIQKLQSAVNELKYIEESIKRHGVEL